MLRQQIREHFYERLLPGELGVQLHRGGRLPLFKFVFGEFEVSGGLGWLRLEWSV